MDPEKAHFFVPTYSLSEIYLFFVQRNFFIKFEFRCGRLKPNLTIFSISDELFMTRFYSFDVPLCKTENFRSHITSHLVRITLEGATCWICYDASISFRVIRPATSTKNKNLYHKDLEKQGDLRDCDTWLSESLVGHHTKPFLLF